MFYATVFYRQAGDTVRPVEVYVCARTTSNCGSRRWSFACSGMQPRVNQPVQGENFAGLQSDRTKAQVRTKHANMRTKNQGTRTYLELSPNLRMSPSLSLVAVLDGILQPFT